MAAPSSPAIPSKAWDHQVDDRINHIIEKLEENPEFSDNEAPGLKDLLSDLEDDNVDVSNVDFQRRLLMVFKESASDYTYSQELSKYTPEEQKHIEDFLEGVEEPQGLDENFVLGPSLGCREELSLLAQVECVSKITLAGVEDITADVSNMVSNSISNMVHDGDSFLNMMRPGVPNSAQNSAQDGDWFSEGVDKMVADFFDAHKGDQWIKVYKNARFQNWGLNIKNKPNFTCVPNSTAGIQTIVRFAKAHDMSVRCSGYRHSWSPIFGRNGQVLISMLDLATVSTLPNITALPLPESIPTELEEIAIVPGKPRIQGNSLVRVGCATTNERLRRWCVDNNKVTIPLNVIMVEITLGGSNAPICHGAGRRHQTLSDLVRKIEYVDAYGKVQSVENPKHLLAASGCFGLMGVVTHITLEFPPMTYAQLTPKKMPVIQAIPPPPGLPEKDIPPALLKHWKNLSAAKKKAFQEDFEQRATSDYYAEWFWFPYNDNAWVNTWNNTEDPKGVVPFPSNTKIWISFAETFLMNVLQRSSLLNLIVKVTNQAEAAVTLISQAAMKSLPDEPVKTYLPDALHFQRAIQNVRVRDIEVEMPLVAKKGGSAGAIDFAPVQQAWWDAILLVYKNSKTCPMRMPLEMRIMGGSEVIMAPQRGNALGTCSIEVLTLESQSKIWQPFAQSVLDKWMALKDPSTGQRLKIRPHWAKEWYNYSVDGKPWIERLKSVDYKEERQEFLQTLSEIGKGAGWTLQDLKDRFSNDLFDKFFFDELPLVGNGSAKNGANGKNGTNGKGH